MAGAMRSAYERLRRTQLKRWISRTFFQRPDHGAALWTMAAPQDRPHVDVLRLGACEWQEMNGCHTVTAPAGYPRHMAEELARHGVGFGFQNIFVWNLEDWPSRHTLLKRRGRMHRRPPDLVLLQVGGWVAMKHFFGFHRRIVALRENLSRWAGPFIWPIHSVIGLSLRFFGRRMPEQGTGQLEEFVVLLRELWPGTRIAIMEPWRTGLKGSFDQVRLEQVTRDLRQTAERLECDWMPAPDFGRGRRLRCSNGFNVNLAGSRHAARHYAAWLLEQDCVRPPVVTWLSAEPVEGAPAEPPMACP